MFAGGHRRAKAIDLRRWFRRGRAFEGGAYLPKVKDRTAGQAIQSFPAPGLVQVPMRQHDGAASTVAVQVGQRVEAGALLGRADEEGAVNVHAPLAGRVVAIDHVDTARHCSVLAVQLKPTESGTAGAPARSDTAPSRPEVWTAAALAQLADEAGLIGAGEPAVGFGRQLRAAASGGTSDIIINALQCEPMLTAEEQLLNESCGAILAAVTWLREALGARRVWLAADHGDRGALRRYRAATAGTPVRVIGLRNKYPQDAPILLAWSVTGRVTPCGQWPEDVGVLVVEPSTLAALAEVAHQRQPLTHRVITVTGPAARHAGHYRVPVGTRFADVLTHVGLTGPVVRVIDGGPLTGQAVETLEAVVTKETRAVVLLDRDHDGIASPGPCVRCGWCQEDCPVGLDPQALLDLVERDRTAEAVNLNPQACVECGLCSYVCPAELPLAEAARQAKQQAALARVSRMTLTETRRELGPQPK